LNLGSVIKFAEAFNGKYSVSQKPLGFTFSKSQSWRIAFQKNSTTPNPFSIIHQTTTPSNAKALFLRKNEKNKQIEKKVSNFKKYIPIYSIPFTKEFSFEKTNCPNTKMIRKTKTDENIAKTRIVNIFDFNISLLLNPSIKFCFNVPLEYSFVTFVMIITAKKTFAMAKR